MDSPDPGSPASSSDSPGIEDISLPPLQEPSYGFSNARSEPYSSGGKRRLPMTSVGSSSKTRRREETSSRRPTATTSTWQTSEYSSTTRSARDEMIDHHVVEKTRQGVLHCRSNIVVADSAVALEWGDPFDLTVIKNNS